ncbi:hypothetical protein MASR2M36_00400 [Providencia sp.]
MNNYFNNIKKTLLSVTLFFPVCIFAKAMTFDLQGSFVDDNSKCSITKHINENNVFGNISQLRNVNSESQRTNIGYIDVDCSQSAKVIFNITAPSTKNNSGLFITSNKSIGLKLLVDGKRITPNNEVVVDVNKGRKIIHFEGSLTRIKKSNETYDRDYNYKIPGFISIDYQ